MSPAIATIVAVLLGYGLGCFSTGYHVSQRWGGVDPRGVGTGSSGARNVGRLVGRWGFAATVAGDLGKGALAPVVATWVGADAWGVAAAAVAVVVGHVWPAALGFRGGRGLTPALGAILVVAWPIATVTCVVAAVLVKVVRRATWAALVAVGLSPVVSIVSGQPAPVVAATGAIVVIVTVSHWPYAVAMAQALTGHLAGRRLPAGEGVDHR